MRDVEAIRLFEEQCKKSVFAIRPVEGDHDNEVFIVNFEHIVRLSLPNKTEEPFYEERNEYYFYEALVHAPRNLPVPPFIFYDSQRNKIELYVAGEEPSFTGPERFSTMEKIIDSITELHGFPVEKGEFNPFARFRHYQKHAKNRLPDGFENDILKRCDEIFSAQPFVASHNHLCASNILLNESGAYFLDLAFCGRNAPIFDLASLVEENDFDSDLARRALIYFNRNSLGSPYSYEELETVVYFLHAFWYYYYSARYAETKLPRFRDLAEAKKKKFLFAFESHLMEADP